MNVEAREAASDAWTRWQGHVINGVFPLGRYLGCSDHSGVFLTKWVGRRSAEVAIKLVPANRALAESLLPRWKRAAAISLAQPHLLRLLEWGGCQLEGLPYLYLVMEYADQTLAQLLLYRALTQEETREMLPPILDALSFLHGRSLVHGQLKPANILVVGDQLKLASDTIRYAQEGAVRYDQEGTAGGLSRDVGDPPEALHGNAAAAGDVWGLGASIFAALTRRAPSVANGEHRDLRVLPADFPPAFWDIVARCLSPRPKDRPRLSELVAWASTPPGGSGIAVGSSPSPIAESKLPEPMLIDPTELGPGTAEPRTAERTATEVRATESKSAAPRPSEARASESKAAAPMASVPRASESNAAAPSSTDRQPSAVKVAERKVGDSRVGTALPRMVPTPAAPDTQRRVSAEALLSDPRALPTLLLAALVALTLGWAGVHAFRSHPARMVSSPSLSASGQSSIRRAAAASAAAEVRAPISGIAASRSASSSTATSPAPLHEVIPDVSASARRTVRGHIKVWIRVILRKDGSVLAAAADRSGPSKYFLRLAIEAAKKWRFPPFPDATRHLVQIRFDFSREGTTARAVTLE